MHSVPTSRRRLPSRRSGSFGSSSAARIAESLTLTWFRFEIFLLWCAVAATAPAAESSGQLLLALLLSPLTALVLWLLSKLAGWVFYFIPGINKLWGYLRLAFKVFFSRLVVEEAPEFEIPLWHQ
jgi:hypothetical protein